MRGMNARRCVREGVAGHDRVLSLRPHYGGPARGDRNHGYADLPHRTGADGVDRTRDIKAQPEVTALRGTREQPAPRRNIRWIQGGCLDLDPYLEHARLGQVDLRHLDDLRAADRLVHNSPHLSVSFTMPIQRTVGELRSVRK